MSERFNAITLLLEDPLNDEEAKEVLAFLRSFRWVSDAKLASPNDVMENIGLWKYKAKLRQELFEVLK